MPSKSKPKKGKNKRTLSNSSPDNTVTLPLKTPKNCKKSPVSDQSVPTPVTMAIQGDDITTKHTNLKRYLKGERERMNQLKTECDHLKAINDDVTDLQARSMRDNILFFGVAEPQTSDDRRSENR